MSYKDEVRKLCQESYYQGSIDSIEVIKKTLFLLKAQGQEHLIISILDKKVKEFTAELEKIKNG